MSTSCRRPCRLSFAIAAALAASSAHAVWSTDPANNLMIAQHDTGSQTVPHMVATPDGGFYVSWLQANEPGDSGTNYSVRLQRLDGAGNKMWGADGILVFHRTEQFVYDYGLDVDTAGNALLAFDAGQIAPNDTIPGGQILAMKIDPSGAFLWGTGGIPVSPAGEVEYLGKIAATSDGKAVVAWFDANSKAVFQKLDTNGSALWANPVAFDGFLSDVQGSDNGNVIVSMRNGGALLTQKLASADGAPLWGASPVVLSDGQQTTGSLGNGYFPGFLSDGSGGAVYTWYLCKGPGQCATRVQRVNAAGTRLFADNAFNGVDVSTDNGVSGTGIHAQTGPSAAFDAASGDTYVTYEDSYQTFNAFAAGFAQRIDSSGARRWGSSGQALEPYTTNGTSFTKAVPVPGGVIAAWASGTPVAQPAQLLAMRLAADGSAVWSTTPTPVKSTTAPISRLTGIDSTLGYAAFVWVDNDGSGGTGDVRAQNLRFDGILGNQAGTPPGVPVMAAVSDSGDSSADALTNNAQPLFGGSCTTNGDSIGLMVDGALVASAPCSGGVYSLNPANAVNDGVHSAKAYAFNANGASAYGAASAFTVDTVPPAITLNSTPTNPSPNDTASFAFSLGESRPMQCRLDAAAFAACTSPVDYAGLAVGSHTFEVKATDAAGNTGTASYTWTIQPAAVVVNLDPASDSGRSNSDRITNANPVLFTGPCTDGDSIQLYNGAAAIGAATLCANSAYAISVSGLAQGNRNITGKATRQGFTGPTGTPLLVVIDRIAPNAPVVSGPASAGPNATITGTAEINAIVAVSDGATPLCTALANGSGAWSCNAAFNSAGSHALTATATDTAGNTGAASTPFNVAVDLSDLIFRNGFDG